MTPPRPARTRAVPGVERDSLIRPGPDDPSPAAVRPFTPRPPGRLLRAFFAVPALVYRLGLGRIFGRRFLLLTHRGRRSGRIRSTVVEAMRFDPTTFESVVAAGWGDLTQWSGNIVASPALRIETGGRRYWPAQRILTPGDVHRELRRYVRLNPRAKGVMTRLGLDLGDGTGSIDVGHLRGVAFRPDPELDPPYQRQRRRQSTRRVYDLFAR